jgi:hypothetical protein
MRMSLEDWAGTLFPLVYAVIAGFAVATSIYVDGMCTKSMLFLAAWIASTCILWSIPFLSNRFGRGKRVHLDERGLLIFKNALLVAHATSWFYFLFACLVAWWIVGPIGSVSINVLPLILVGWLVVFQFALVLGRTLQDRFGRHHGQ